MWVYLVIDKCTCVLQCIECERVKFKITTFMKIFTHVQKCWLLMKHFILMRNSALDCVVCRRICGGVLVADDHVRKCFFFVSVQVPILYFGIILQFLHILNFLGSTADHV